MLNLIRTVAKAVMVPASLLLGLLVLATWPDIASAQEWTRYVNRALQFTIRFPAPPEISDTSYITAAGTTLPAQTFTAAYGTGLYRLTVVDFSASTSEQRGATALAAEAIAQRGVAEHNRYAYMDGLPGHHLSVVEPQGRRLIAAVYLFDHRLYIVEGSDVLSAPPPGLFTHSIIITHPDGTQLNLDGYNAESFNAFESED